MASAAAGDEDVLPELATSRLITKGAEYLLERAAAIAGVQVGGLDERARGGAFNTSFEQQGLSSRLILEVVGGLGTLLVGASPAPSRFPPLIGLGSLAVIHVGPDFTTSAEVFPHLPELEDMESQENSTSSVEITIPSRSTIS